MSGILGGGGKTAGTTVTRYTSLQVQTSAAGVGIPIGWGTNRTGTNLIWYGNFQSTGQSQGGKGGGGGGTSYTYSTAVAMALGEGPIAGIGQVWAGKDASTLDKLNLTLMTGTAGQAVLSSLYSTAPDQALAYPLTAYVGSPKYDLGSSASLPNHNFEVMWGLRNAPNGKDANPADILLDFLTNPQYGMGLQASQVADLTSYRDYCAAAGLFLSPLLTDQNAASDTINRWGTLTNTAIFWSGGQLKAVPLGDRPLVGNGGFWTPDLTPVYDLTDDDFLADSSSGDPVTLNRSDVADSDNIVQLEYLDRSNAYQTAIATARDQSAIDAWGQRVADPTQAHDICDATVAAVAAQLVLQRQLYIRNTYTFKLGWAYGLLEPGDIVTLTDTALGLDKFPVRITGIDEDSDGTLTMTAEELPAGIGTATEYPRPTTANTPLNTSVDPGEVAQAVITEPSPGLTGGVQQVWIGAVGASNWWGGCHVWLSVDDETYKQIGSITEPCRVGTLVTALPVAADPDTSDAAQVTLASPRVQLVGGTQADADAGRTLALIDGEMVAYATATLTGPSTYRLSYLRRGMYGTGIAAHVAGASFARLDDALFRYDLPAAYVGQRLYIKLTSFNLFDAAEQSLADVQAYTYTPVGALGMLPPPGGLTLTPQTSILADGTVQLGIGVSWTPPDAGAAVDTVIRWQATGGTWQSVRIPAGTTTATLGPVVQNVAYTVQAASSLGPDVQSNWTAAQTITLGGVLGGASVTGLELYGQGLNTAFQGRDVRLTWRGNFPATAYDVGGEPYGAGSGIVNPYFKCYVITVADPATGAILRTDYTATTDYTYTYQDNVLDGGPRRSLTFTVAILDKLGGQTPGATISVSNPVPAPVQLSPLPTTAGTLLLGYIPPTGTDALDFAGVNIWYGDTADVDTNGTPAVTGSSPPLVLGGLTPGATCYLVSQTFDTFGTAGCPISAPLAVTLPLVSAADMAKAIIGDDQLTPDLLKRITTTADTAVETRTVVTDLSAMQYLKVDAYGNVAGIGEYADAAGSRVSIYAGVFSIALPSPSNPLGYVTPFAVGTYGGQPAIVMDAAVYTGPLHAEQVATGTLGADVVYAGTVKASQISSGAIGTVKLWATANGLISGPGLVLDGTANQMTIGDGTRTRVLLGEQGGDYGIWTWDASGTPVIVGGALGNNIVNTPNVSSGSITNHAIVNGYNASLISAYGGTMLIIFTAVFLDAREGVQAWLNVTDQTGAVLATVSAPGVFADNSSRTSVYMLRLMVTAAPKSTVTAILSPDPSMKFNTPIMTISEFRV